MESKLNDIKNVQQGEFYWDSKIFLVMEKCLLLINQDGTTYRKYPKVHSNFHFAFLLDSNHIILKPERTLSSVEVLNTTTGEIKEFHAFNNSETLVNKSNKKLVMFRGKLLTYPFVKFYYDDRTSAIWDVETGKKESVLKEDYGTHGSQLELPDGRIVWVGGFNTQLILEKGKKNKVIDANMLVKNPISLLRGSSDVIITYGHAHYKPQLKTFKFPINEEPFALETYPLLYEAKKAISISSTEVFLYTENGIAKFNFKTGKYTENFIKEKSCGQVESSINPIVVETGNKFRILKCLLLLKLKKQLPRDLILEVYTFF